MTTECQVLKGKWLDLFNQCLESKGDFPYSNADGFEQKYETYLKSGILIKQKANNALSITEASNIADNAAKHAITDIRYKFRDRCSSKEILKQLRNAQVHQIPGEKKISNEMGARFQNIVASIHTYMLSPPEVKYIISKFEPELIQYDAEQWVLTIKTFELHLEEAEPTIEECIELDKIAKATVPSLISYIHSGDGYEADWGELISDIKSKIKSIVANATYKYKKKNEVVDIDYIEKLFDDTPSQ